MRNAISPVKKYRINPVITVFMIICAILPMIYGCKESLQLTKMPSRSKTEKLRTQALGIIEQGLNNSDPRIRAKAVEVVAATSQKQLMPRVQKLLGDDYVPVRFASALAIGDVEYYLAKNDLQRLSRVADENTKIAAAYAMCKLGYKEYIEPIRQAVKSPDQTLRANAVVLLGKIRDTDSLEVLYWAKDADDSEPKVRYQATEAIARLGDEQIMPKVWTLLVSKFVENKIIGVKAMGALGTIQAKEALLTKLEDDIFEVQLAAAEQLAVLGDNSGEQTVLNVFEEKLTAGLDARGRERIMVLSAIAIGQLQTPRTVKYLPKLIESDSVQVRLAAAQAAMQIPIE